MSIHTILRFFSALVTINAHGGIAISGPIEARAERLLVDGSRIEIDSRKETIHLPEGEGLFMQSDEEAVVIRPKKVEG